MHNADLQKRDMAAWRRLYQTPSADPIWHSLPFLSSIAEHFVSEGAYRILDAACGDGGQMVGFSDKQLFVGVDQSSRALAAARRHLHARGRKNVVLCRSNLSRTPFPAGSFDGVLFIDTLSCFLEPTTVLREFWRLLMPGGTLFLTTFSKSDPIANELEYLGTAVGLFGGKFINVLYSEGELTELVESTGFEVTSISERRDNEAPHPVYRDKWHEHVRHILTARRK